MSTFQALSTGLSPSGYVSSDRLIEAELVSIVTDRLIHVVEESKLLTSCETHEGQASKGKQPTLSKLSDKIVTSPEKSP